MNWKERAQRWGTKLVRGLIVAGSRWPSFGELLEPLVRAWPAWAGGWGCLRFEPDMVVGLGPKWWREPGARPVRSWERVAEGPRVSDAASTFPVSTFDGLTRGWGPKRPAGPPN